jgi:hypothetical protein
MKSPEITAGFLPAEEIVKNHFRCWRKSPDITAGFLPTEEIAVSLAARGRGRACCICSGMSEPSRRSSSAMAAANLACSASTLTL